MQRPNFAGYRQAERRSFTEAQVLKFVQPRDQDHPTRTVLKPDSSTNTEPTEADMKINPLKT
jgi:hypothetical protein